MCCPLSTDYIVEKVLLVQNNLSQFSASYLVAKGQASKNCYAHVSNPVHYSPPVYEITACGTFIVQIEVYNLKISGANPSPTYHNYLGPISFMRSQCHLPGHLSTSFNANTNIFYIYRFLLVDTVSCSYRSEISTCIDWFFCFWRFFHHCFQRCGWLVVDYSLDSFCRVFLPWTISALPKRSLCLLELSCAFVHVLHVSGILFCVQLSTRSSRALC